jgi:hypothetical protein
MWWLLANPLSLLGLAAIPVVVGIYLFRTRARRREVSSLFLWVDQQKARQGGRRLQKLQTPLLLLLELLAILLMILAAAGPRVRAPSEGEPVVVILDASYSMMAGAENSPRSRAMKKLTDFFNREAGYPVYFISAGDTPRLLGTRAKTPAEAEALLREWTCEEAGSNISAAISLGNSIAPAETRLLIVTDHPPGEEIPEGKIRWESFGLPMGNLAIVHASRRRISGQDKLLLEVANLSRQPRRCLGLLSETETDTPLQKIDELIRPDENIRLRMNLPDDLEAVTVKLAEDPLKIDNRVTVLEPPKKLVRVQIQMRPSSLRDVTEEALAATGLARIVEANPELIITDRASPSDSGAATAASFSTTWRLVIDASEDATPPPAPPETTENTDREETAESRKVTPLVGPFVLDRNHPLTEGLDLDGVVWAADDRLLNWGYPVISAGNIPLVTERNRADGTVLIHLRLVPKLSTVTMTPNWPILFWNLLAWKGAESPGVENPNVPLGSEVVFHPAAGDESLEVIAPDGRRQSLEIRSESVPVGAERVGVYRLEATSGEYAFSVGALSTSESDLTGLSEGRWGGWLDEETIREDYHSIAWWFLLGALGTLALHMVLIAQRPTGIGEQA